jgi:hypothetical protein
VHPATLAPAMISRLGHRVPRRRQRGALPALAPSGRNVCRSGHRPRYRIVRPCARYWRRRSASLVAGVAWPPPHQRRRGDHGLMRSCDSSPEPKMLRGTEGSNPSPSSVESVSRGTLSSWVKNPGFPRVCSGLRSRTVSRDPRGPADMRQPAKISLSGYIPVPHFRRYGRDKLSGLKPRDCPQTRSGFLWAHG